MSIFSSMNQIVKPTLTSMKNGKVFTSVTFWNFGREPHFPFSIRSLVWIYFIKYNFFVFLFKLDLFFIFDTRLKNSQNLLFSSSSLIKKIFLFLSPNLLFPLLLRGLSITRVVRQATCPMDVIIIIIIIIIINIIINMRALNDTDC